MGDDQPVIPGLEGLSHYQVRKYRSGPVAPPEELREYEDILPGAADRILRMAEATLDAENQAKLVPLKAEAWAVKFATTGVTALPYACITTALIVLSNGYDAAAIIAAIAAALSAGPQVIAATRRKG